MKILKRFLGKGSDALILRLFSSWCFTAIAFLLANSGSFENINDFAGVKLTTVICVAAASFGILTAAAFVSSFTRFSSDRIILPAVFFALSFSWVIKAGDLYFSLVVAAVAAVLVYYYSVRGYLPANRLKKRGSVFALIILIAVFALLCGSYGVLRYTAYQSPNYDFGIFAQMFANMKRSFAPVTTVERDKLLSHFAVHFSPALYLLLPVYFVFPSPATLQISQTLLLASGAVPLFLIARQYKIGRGRALLLSAMLLFHPALMAGTSYDFHENCLLIPFLIWMFWAFETDRSVFLAIFAVLTLSVKEDAAVYVAFFALYTVFARKKYIRGAALFAGAVIWFFAAVALLTKYGEGIMAGRFENYASSDNDSLFVIVKNILADPGFVFTQLLQDKGGAHTDKLMFIAEMVVPFAFLPFITKKISNLILFLPMLLINLMPMYVYQYDIGFQYVYGPLAFLAYLSVINAAGLGSERSKGALTAGLAAALLLFATVNVPKLLEMTERNKTFSEFASLADSAIESIGEDETVVASTYLIPHMSDRKEVYETFYHKYDESRGVTTVLLDCRYSSYRDALTTYYSYGFEIDDMYCYENGELALIKMKKEAVTANDEDIRNSDDGSKLSQSADG